MGWYAIKLNSSTCMQSNNTLCNLNLYLIIKWLMKGARFDSVLNSLTQ